MHGEFVSELEKQRFAAWFAPICLKRYHGREAMERIYDYQKALADPENADEEFIDTALVLLQRYRSFSQ